jgi:hypothetical protein
MIRISLIIFTYKRAILLEEVLKSIFKNFKNLSLPIYVIYHFDKNHHKSYLVIKKKWKSKNVIFYERRKISIINSFKYFLINPLNFFWILRWVDILKNWNSFKFLLEKVLRNIKTEYVTMVPDDQYFYNKTIISSRALEIISKNEKSYFYRFFTGDHFKGYNSLPKKLKIKFYKDKFAPFFEWSHKNSAFKKSPLWNYRFTIEGTVFHKNTLLKLISRFLYHNPITLEAIGLWESRLRSFFSNGLSSKKRTAAGFQINSVQKHVFHRNNNFNTEILMKAYLKGYRLHISRSIFKRNNFDVVPDNIFFKKKNSIKISYKNLLVRLKSI